MAFDHVYDFALAASAYIYVFTLLAIGGALRREGVQVGIAGGSSISSPAGLS